MFLFIYIHMWNILYNIVIANTYILLYTVAIVIIVIQNLQYIMNESS